MFSGQNAYQIADIEADKHRIQIAASAFQGKLLCRLSAQIYNERTDFEHLVDVCLQDGWTSRR